MDQPLIDNALLAGALIFALVMLKAPGRRMKAIPSTLLLFAPMVIFLNMWGHIVAVLFVNYQRYVSGAFHFNFHFYSLLLMGIVFIFLSGLNINLARKIIRGNNGFRRTIHIINGVTALLFLPMFVLNPIALLPVIASAVSSSTLLFTKVSMAETSADPGTLIAPKMGSNTDFFTAQ